MNRELGFGKTEERLPVRGKDRSERCCYNAPRRSLVRVCFAGVPRTYVYYNDQFDLEAGDPVYVSGCFAGKLGYVESVNYRFKIDLADYERVVAHPSVELHGTYRQIMDKLVSFDAEAIGPDAARSWAKPPVPEGEEPPQYVRGEGYRFELERFTESEEIEPGVLARAVDYAENGHVKYLTLRDGVGTAFVEGAVWYEVNFAYRDGVVSDLYCECPYPGLCKHILAVLITLKELLERTESENFTAVERSFFMRILFTGGQEIRL